jgi:hypothetical protein
MAIFHRDTVEFTQKAVGPGCVNQAGDVWTVQQLLRAAGQTVGVDGGWGGNTADGLQAFRTRQVTPGLRAPAALKPNDELLLAMAEKADLLVPLSGFSGISGVRDTHQWFKQKKTRYNEGAQFGRGDRALWGVHGDACFVVQTIKGGFSAGPVEMDCTIYVNLMASIYLRGDAHGGSYVADCSAFGGITERHLARERYGFPLVRRTVGGKSVNYFATALEIAEATKTAPASLYVLEVGGGRQGGVSHMALLSGFTVYECTTGQAGSSCIDRSLEDFMASKTGKIIYLFGPR